MWPPKIVLSCVVVMVTLDGSDVWFCQHTGRIMDHQNSLQFPSDVGMSQDAKKLISAFLESG